MKGLGGGGFWRGGGGLFDDIGNFIRSGYTEFFSGKLFQIVLILQPIQPLLQLGVLISKRGQLLFFGRNQLALSIGLAGRREAGRAEGNQDDQQNADSVSQL